MVRRSFTPGFKTSAAKLVREQGGSAATIARRPRTSRPGESDPDRPDTAWAADITCIPTAEGRLYSAAVIDPCSREMVGWATAGQLRSKSPAEALRMALSQRRPPGGLLHHGDDGLRSASDAYRSSLAEYGIEPSMGRKGDRWSDAMAEGFSGTPKRGLVHLEGSAGHAQARRSLFESVEVFHDRTRRHSSIGYRSPAEFEAGLTSPPTRAHNQWARSAVGSLAVPVSPSPDVGTVMIRVPMAWVIFLHACPRLGSRSIKISETATVRARFPVLDLADLA